MGKRILNFTIWDVIVFATIAAIISFSVGFYVGDYHAWQAITGGR